MQVLAHIHNLRRFTESKKKAEVSLIVSEPDTMIRIRLFESHERQGLIEQLEHLKGQDIQIPLEFDVFQGRPSFSLAYGGKPIPLKQNG